MRRSLIAISAIALAASSANAVVIASFENDAQGWAPPATGGNSANFQVGGFSTTTGVTDGAYSLIIEPTAANTSSGPNYGQMLLSPSTNENTALLGSAASLSIDVYTPPGSFGFFLQFDVDVNNLDTGYQSLVNYSYIGTSIGAQSTLTFPVSASIASTLATSANPTQIIIQTGGGFTAGNESFYLDNIRVNLVPEPVSAFAVAGAAAVVLRRRRA